LFNFFYKDQLVHLPLQLRDMKIHFIAIAGSAMHNLAIALKNKKYVITGSDDAIFEPSKTRLHNAALLPAELGWYPEKITKNLDAIVLGMHAKVDNTELLKAQELGVTIYSYPEFLYEQSKNKTRVVIGGSHGKTTITSMILHVLNYHGRKVDYMVGAQLDGFDCMVHLTDDNDFIVLEGDEYLSSPIDRRPKFHLYKPNIALLSGIAWDHINVFPTFNNYKEQFKIFVDSIVSGGSITYNSEDAVVQEIVRSSTNTIRKLEYTTCNHLIENGTTQVETPEGLMPVLIFGKHNLSNLSGAKWICQNMGVDEEDFFEAIGSFKGASKRLEKIGETQDRVIFKDFAHSPSKVLATTNAVKEQFPDKKLLVVLELHTYSSFDPAFLKEYQGALDHADEAVIFFLPASVAIKKLEAVSQEQIKSAFKRDNLQIFTEAKTLHNFVYNKSYDNTALLLMSSGDYGGMDLGKIKRLFS